MEIVSLAEASEHLEDLAQRAMGGEDVRIIHPKLGTFQLVPVQQGLPAGQEPFVPLKADRVPGRLSGKMTVPKRLLEPMSDQELQDWYGEDA